MSEQFVRVIKMSAPESVIIRIEEPGSQQTIRFIECTPTEALEILRQLEEVLSR